jgi:hypothetical protein
MYILDLQDDNYNVNFVYPLINNIEEYYYFGLHNPSTQKLAQKQNQKLKKEYNLKHHRFNYYKYKSSKHQQHQHQQQPVYYNLNHGFQSIYNTTIINLDKLSMYYPSVINGTNIMGFIQLQNLLVYQELNALFICVCMVYCCCFRNIYKATNTSTNKKITTNMKAKIYATKNDFIKQ